MHSQETEIYIILLIAAGILGLILVFFIITILRQQRKHQQLHREKINAEIKTLEKERKRVARDLHDEVAMLLSVAKLELSSMSNVTPENKNYVSKASKHIDNGLEKIREIAKDLVPVALIRKGLLFALEELFEPINETNKLSIEYSLPDAPIHLSEGTQIHLYRVIQEILHNTLKHAQASKITYTLKQKEKYLQMCFADNGTGFNVEKNIRERSGLGLHNILSRIEMLNGTIYLDTAEGKGAAYTIEIPLTQTL